MPVTRSRKEATRRSREMSGDNEASNDLPTGDREEGTHFESKEKKFDIAALVSSRCEACLIDPINRRRVLQAFYGAALLLRLALLGYGILQDRSMRVQYTDIDYHVVTNGATMISQGRNVYDAPGYRYTPLMAMVLLPNLIWNSFGKFLYCAVDIVCLYVIQILLKRRPLMSRTHRLFAAALWGGNIFAAAISSRGSGDSIACLQYLLAIEALTRSHNGVGIKEELDVAQEEKLVSRADRKKKSDDHVEDASHRLSARHLAEGGFWWGLSVHWRIFPIIFAFSFLAFLLCPVDRKTRPKNFKEGLRRLSVFYGVAALTFCGLFIGFYLLYGKVFVDECYLYHFRRSDLAHNFSPYFYLVNYTRAREDPKLHVTIQIGYTIFQLASAATAGLYFGGRSLPFALFLQTIVFVMLNKIITAQYFIWWMALLPFAGARVPLSFKNFLAAICILAAWFLSEFHWLYWAYRLEFESEPMQLQVFLSSLIFMFANLNIIIFSVVRGYRGILDSIASAPRLLESERDRRVK